MFYIFPEIEGEQKRLGISIKFHEDSTLRDLLDGIVEANTPSEFMQASLPGKRFFPGWCRHLQYSHRLLYGGFESIYINDCYIYITINLL